MSQIKYSRLFSFLGCLLLWSGVSDAEPLNAEKLLQVRYELQQKPAESALKEASIWVQHAYHASKWIIMGDVAFFQDDVSLATQLIEGLPETVTDGERYLYKGIRSKANGDRTIAKHYFEVVTRDPQRLIRAKGFYFMGELTYLALKDPESNLRELERSHYFFQKAIEANPKMPEGYFGIARRYIHIQDWEEAIDYLELALKVDPNDFISLYNLGVIFSEKKLWAKAYQHLKVAHELRPKDLKAIHEFIWVAHQVGEAQHAIQALEVYLADPAVTSQTALPLIQQVLFRKIERDFHAGQIKRALDQYLQLEKRFPNVPEIAIRIGICYREMGRAHDLKAQSYFEAFMQKRPKDHLGYFELGVLKFKQGEYVEAAKHFIQSLQLNPRDNGNTWLWTAKSLESLDLMNEAMFVLSKAIIQPQLEVQYRDAVLKKLKVFEKDPKLTSMDEMTFSMIEHRLRTYEHADDAKHKKKPSRRRSKRLRL